MTAREAARYLIERVQRNTNWDDEDVLAAALMANSFGIPLFVCARCDHAATVYDETQEMDVCDEHAEGSPNDLDPLKTVAQVLAEAGLDPAELRSERVQAGEPPSSAPTDPPPGGAVGPEGMLSPAQLPDMPTAGTLLVARERRRQIEAEGFDAAHDARHSVGDLAAAAESYLTCVRIEGGDADWLWPWDESLFKPLNARRDLERAAALAIAALDRLLADEGPGGQA